MSFLEPTISQMDNHFIMQNVYKPIRSKYVNIDSTFSDEYNTSSLAKFSITFPQILQDVKQIQVEHMEIPIQYYNFSSNRKNTTMNITEITSGTVYTLTITDNQYDISQTLLSEINTQWNKINTDLSFGFVNNRIQIKNISANKTYKISFAVDENGQFDKIRLKSKLGWVLGFRKIEYTLSPSLVATAEGSLQLNTFRYLYLVIDEHSANFTNSFQVPIASSGFLSKNVIARISLGNTTYGKVTTFSRMYGNFYSDLRSYNGKTDIQKLKIELIDEWGNIIHLNLSDFSFCLRVDYE